MPATKEPQKQAPPTSLRIKPETLGKLRKIAKVNGLSVADVINLSIASGLTMVETKLGELHGKSAAA